MPERIVIVGAGLGGARAALSLRERGFAGEITLIGDETHAPYDRPPLSKQALLDEPDPRLIAPLEALAQADITHIGGVRVDSIDRAQRCVILNNGISKRYDKLLLATGARPRMLPGLRRSERLLTLRTHDDAVAIRERLTPGARMIVIGGGFIGLELAATARWRGLAVTVIEGLPRLMARAVPAEIAAVMEARHREEGVEILLESAVAAVREKDDEIHVELQDGSVVAGEFAVVGIGAIPNDELAAQTGLLVDNGIAVDRFMRTSDPDIYAVGDCCSFPAAIFGDRRIRLESWRSAQDQGTLVAGNMLGGRKPFVDVPWSWSDQYDLTLQVAGLATTTTKSVRRDLGDGAFILFHLEDEGRIVAASGIGIGNAVGRDIRLAEMLIAAQAKPSMAALGSSNIKLKSLLAA
ncbi:FAD-dependent oxidoreductase [Rhizobium sp. TH2]|uniref:NAD(P)/FAD-dependent oxidoreductase n=1 Tax=Rhizobium sp. TH2 TaxID=2775403 RepID=UPI00215883AA|nr:FAD-dependent oxidoreductase [Rhizobium sp. TH2]UVC06832.1 FAD-dependent oxidoreductase [Rhizobium sp. TH2]